VLLGIQKLKFSLSQQPSIWIENPNSKLSSAYLRLSQLSNSHFTDTANNVHFQSCTTASKQIRNFKE